MPSGGGPDAGACVFVVGWAGQLGVLVPWDVIAVAAPLGFVGTFPPLGIWVSGNDVCQTMQQQQHQKY